METTVIKKYFVKDSNGVVHWKGSRISCITFKRLAEACIDGVSEHDEVAHADILQELYTLEWTGKLTVCLSSDDLTLSFTEWLSIVQHNIVHSIKDSLIVLP